MMRYGAMTSCYNGEFISALLNVNNPNVMVIVVHNVVDSEGLKDHYTSHFSILYILVYNLMIDSLITILI